MIFLPIAKSLMHKEICIMGRPGRYRVTRDLSEGLIPQNSYDNLGPGFPEKDQIHTPCVHIPANGLRRQKLKNRL